MACRMLPCSEQGKGSDTGEPPKGQRGADPRNSTYRSPMRYFLTLSGSSCCRRSVVVAVDFAYGQLEVDYWCTFNLMPGGVVSVASVYILFSLIMDSSHYPVNRTRFATCFIISREVRRKSCKYLTHGAILAVFGFGHFLTSDPHTNNFEMLSSESELCSIGVERSRARMNSFDCIFVVQACHA